MEWVNILQQICNVFVIPIIGALALYLIAIINTKRNQIKQKTNNEIANKYIDLLSDTITNCVIATNQTYVEALKEKNLFDAEAQKTALNQTYNAVLAILTADAKEYLTNIYGDLYTYIMNKIEAEVNIQKELTAHEVQ